MPENTLSQNFPVNGTMFKRLWKKPCDRFYGFPAFTQKIMHGPIGIMNRQAKLAQKDGRRAFTHTDAAGKADHKHAALFRGHDLILTQNMTAQIVRHFRLDTEKGGKGRPR